MDVGASLPAFLAAVPLISASPGPAMALIVRRAALRGLRSAVPTVLGLELGLYAWALFAGAGSATLVAASGMAYPGLRVLGAAVLLYLGVKALRHDGAARAAAGHAGVRALPRTGRRGGPGGDLVPPARVRARVEAVSGTVFIALGVRVATTAR